MGHQHLLTLPKTRLWKDVVAMISGGANLSAIAAAASAAAERSMIDTAEDATVRHTFYLLCQIPLAATDKHFAAALRARGLTVSDTPDLIEIAAAFMTAIDRHVLASEPRTDYGELAQLSAVEALHHVAGKALPDLFGAQAAHTRSGLARLARGSGFAELARDFFARLTRRHLEFYLHRELSGHVGAGRRFASFREHFEFEQALDLHCREASRIIREFAAGWLEKHRADEDIGADLAGRFVHVAAGKIREELRRREPAHA